MNVHTLQDPLTILVAEDSATQAEQLRYLLEKRDFRVVIARNGKEALELMQVKKPALVITDITMPEMDGYELCHQIRAHKELRDLPVILLTSLANPEDVFKGLECGADNFITKPYKEENLLARINYLLANIHLRVVENTQVSMEVFLAGRNHVITSDRAQILNLLLSTYEAAVQKNTELAKVRDDLAILNEQLEEKVAERTALLASEVAERKRAEEQVRKLNDDLELQVARRTEQLTEANRELESFSYSVSHDLRTPLRHIMGYADLLQAEAGPSLDKDNQHYLKVITKSVKRMGELIDDLLAFSRMSRSELTKTSVNLDLLLKESISDLENETKGRNILWQKSPLGMISGDQSLLRQVFVNLIGNALKFTRNRAQAKIEIGLESSESDEIIICIRDNGVGFDMKSAEKMFGVFQRFHRNDEFEGTGIGLATVHRIIRHHGGRIWAKGATDVGSTFYLALPKMKGAHED